MYLFGLQTTLSTLDLSIISFVIILLLLCVLMNPLDTLEFFNHDSLGFGCRPHETNIIIASKPPNLEAVSALAFCRWPNFVYKHLRYAYDRGTIAAVQAPHVFHMQSVRACSIRHNSERIELLYWIGSEGAVHLLVKGPDAITSRKECPMWQIYVGIVCIVCFCRGICEILKVFPVFGVKSKDGMQSRQGGQRDRGR